VGRHRRQLSAEEGIGALKEIFQLSQVRPASKITAGGERVVIRVDLLTALNFRTNLASTF
jgi:hypothetical protein